MSQRLVTHFVDGSGVDLAIDVAERRVEMSAFDEATRQRYVLTFARCLAISPTYKEWADGEGDRYNLTEGVAELPSSANSERRFRIGFVDESVLEVVCREFAMVPVTGGRYPQAGPARTSPGSA